MPHFCAQELAALTTGIGAVAFLIRFLQAWWSSRAG
jgi:hypothetical protein